MGHLGEICGYFYGILYFLIRAIEQNTSMTKMIRYLVMNDMTFPGIGEKKIINEFPVSWNRIIHT